MMRELAIAKALMNLEVREGLESRPIYDPAGFDVNPQPPPPFLFREDELLDIGGDDVTVVGGRLRARMPWEVLP